MHPLVNAVWEQGDELMLEERDAEKDFDLLAVANKHPRDDWIVFRERDHFYAITDGSGRWISKHLTSATKVGCGATWSALRDTLMRAGHRALLRAVPRLHHRLQHREEAVPARRRVRLLRKLPRTLTRLRFDAELAKQHPRIAVAGITFAPRHGPEDAVDGSFLQASQRAICELSQRERDLLFDGYFGEYAGLETAEKVMAHWRKSTTFGTAFHLDIERHINGLAPLMPEDSKPWGQYMAYLEAHGRDFYRTEWRIHDTKRLITGTIDAARVVRRDSLGRVTHIALVDWKTNKDIHGDANAKPKYFFHMLSHMQDNKVNKYCMQLNVYRKIIEEYYDLVVCDMEIAVFHPNYDRYQLVKVPRLERETDLLFAAHEEMLVHKLGGPMPAWMAPKEKTKRQRKKA